MMRGKLIMRVSCDNFIRFHDIRYSRFVHRSVRSKVSIRLPSRTPHTCNVAVDALPRPLENSATICCTAALSAVPGTAASRTRTSPISSPASCSHLRAGVTSVVK